MDWLIGLLGSGTIAALAYWKKSLSGSGAFAAMVVGTLLYAVGSIAWFGPLLAFFISSSLLSTWKQTAKREAEARYEKTGRRDAGQVLANGGLGVLLCLLNGLMPNTGWWFAFIGVMATVTADTWATEIGGLSRGNPISILTGRRVPKGTSGGISARGLLASVAGGGFIGVMGWLFLLGDAKVMPGFGAMLLLGVVAGTAGSLTDSLIGAKWQAMYRCVVCGREVEAKKHCGAVAKPISGLGFCNNDVVNFVSSAVGGMVAVWLFL